MKEAWSVDGGELTATMKLKRKPVLSKYTKNTKRFTLKKSPIGAFFTPVFKQFSMRAK